MNKLLETANKFKTKLAQHKGFERAKKDIVNWVRTMLKDPNLYVNVDIIASDAHHTYEATYYVDVTGIKLEGETDMQVLASVKKYKDHVSGALMQLLNRVNLHPRAVVVTINGA